jgi:hypothetical protein
MMRCASSAFSAFTVTRTSFTVSGKGVLDRSVEIIASTPIDSSNPRTTSASIGEGVRKTTVSSPTICFSPGPVFHAP